MVSDFTKEVKQKLADMGKDEFICKNEYRVFIGEKRVKHGWSAIDHVWLKNIPHPGEKPSQVVVVAFEITKDIATLWNTKKMKGDITNLRLSNASLGVLIIPTIDKLKEQARKIKGGEKWIEGIHEYLNALKKIAEPMKIEFWSYDEQGGVFNVFSPGSRS